MMMKTLFGIFFGIALGIGTANAQCLDLQTLAPGDTNYITKHNENYSTIETAICGGGGGGGGQCTGGDNDGDFCLAAEDCPGTCIPHLGAQACQDDLEEPCTSNADCAGACTPGDCSTCGQDGQCFGGAGGVGDGDACTDDADCPEGGRCGFGRCSTSGEACSDNADCPEGETCNYTGCLNCNEFTGSCEDGQVPTWDEATERFQCRYPRVCVGGENAGEPCLTDENCRDGTCERRYEVCFGGPGDGDPCTDDADCPEGGTCRPNDDICWGGDNDGDRCRSDVDCTGTCTAGECVDNPGEVCASDADCQGVCLDPDDTCNGLDTCGSVYCTTNTDCGDTCECYADNVCQGGANDGDPCTNDEDCPTGICVDQDEVCQGGSNDGNPCTDDADCPGGGECKPPGDGIGVQGPAGGVRADSIARWDGSSGGYINDTGVQLRNRIFVGAAVLGFADLEDELNRWVGIGSDVDDAPDGKGAIYVLPWNRPAYKLGATPTCTASVCTGEGPDDGNTCAVNADCRKGDQAYQYLLNASGEESGVLGRTLLDWKLASYPIVINIPAAPLADALKIRIPFTEKVICPDDFRSSIAYAFAEFDSAVEVTIKKNTATIGTIDFASGGTPPISGDFATSGGSSTYYRGDYIVLEFPATADTTGGQIAINLACVKATD